MKSVFVFASVLSLTGCSTLNDSLLLGAVVGSAGGATAQYSAARSAGSPATLENAYGGASIGLGLGVLAAYLIHQSVVEGRDTTASQTEFYFGDLPPSPFVTSPVLPKKGKFR